MVRGVSGSVKGGYFHVFVHGGVLVERVCECQELVLINVLDNERFFLRVFLGLGFWDYVRIHFI